MKACVDCGQPHGKAAQAKRCAACRAIDKRAKCAARAVKYYHADRETFLARAAAYRSANRAVVLRKTKAWRRANLEELNARRREQHAANPEPARIRARLCAAQRRAHRTGRVSAKQWREIQETFGYVCAYCGQTEPLGVAK